MPLFSGIFPVMRSADVAQIGYEGLKAGRAVVITGLLNKIMAMSGRFSPSAIALRVSAGMTAGRSAGH